MDSINLIPSTMQEVFIKKYWPDGNVLFYVHFQDGHAVRQIEITPQGKIFLTTDQPQKGDAVLYDQTIDELGLQRGDYVTDIEFERVWEEGSLE